ncbi:MAG: SDR family NAD(P)-dependent oxidoreductase [Terrimesophilobacter sp.]
MTLQGKTVVITGASAGIGRAAARSLANQGAHVAVVGRNAERTAAVADEVGGSAFVADFDHLTQVRTLTDALLERFPRIDVLANNAGGMISSRGTTPDGFERTIQANYYSPFLLTQLLLPRLRESNGRVIGTASAAHHFANLRISDLDRGFEPYFGGWRSYGASKLATIYFMRELARREGGNGITAYSMHPGYVSTGFGDRSRMVALSRIINGGKLGLSPQQGAGPLVHLASAETIDAPNGSYFNRFDVNGNLSRAARDESRDSALWDRTVDVLGLPKITAVD